MEINADVCSPDAARKRQVNKENWKVNKQKELRYSPKNLPVYPACGHRGKTLNCSLLTMTDIKEFHSAFYSVKTKMSQDAFILKYCSAAPPIRYRPKSGERGKKKLKYKYFVRNQVRNRIEVCRAAFIGVLGITKHRVEGTFTRFKKQGCDIPQETRGGYRKDEKYRPKIESVVDFIKKFKGLESHYSRKNTCRVYLDSNLSIAKMWRMYQNSVEDEFKVKQGLFRSVFVTKFNLSFHAPSTDVCSKCLELNERIKREKNDSEKNTLKIKLNLHKAQAKAFFSLLKVNEPGLYIISFDMQKNLPLPKLPDQSCYYSRQLYCYNLTVVSGVSCGKKALDKDNVSIYTWTENDMSKSSNEVASAVFNELQTKLSNGDFNDVHTVRLVADGCGGQNKNTIVLAMCLNWLSCSPQQITRMEIVFPITGHSFMPSDRVFGCIEREIKTKDTIVTLKEYHDCFAGQGIVKKLGSDWDDYDWKAKAKEFVKDTKDLHFKISRVRRLILTKNRPKKCIDVQGEMTYSHETATALQVNKPGKKLSSIKPNKQIPGIVVQPAKLKDVRKLLEKHYGANWTEVNDLQWYKDILEKNNPLNEAEPQEDEEDVLCECATNVEDDDEVLEIVV